MCDKKTAIVFLFTFAIISFSDIHKFLGLISTNTGLRLFWITDEISETHVRVGTITSPGPFKIFKIFMVKKFADDPELTKTLYFTPSHLDHLLSNSLTFLD